MDDEQFSHQIGQHFIDRHFPHFASYGIEGESWSQRRGEAFRKVSESGESFAWINSLRGISEGDSAHFSKLKQWLLELPKPCAVMVCSDQCGLTLLEACRAAEIIVPEQLAVVGVDNDLALCEISTPNLSSVRGGHRLVGFEAANLLNKIINGEPTPSERILIPPNQIVVRETSDSRSIPDPVVRNAIQFIREHFSEPITNEDVAKAVGLSRTRL